MFNIQLLYYSTETDTATVTCNLIYKPAVKLLYYTLFYNITDLLFLKILLFQMIFLK